MFDPNEIVTGPQQMQDTLPAKLIGVGIGDAEQQGNVLRNVMLVRIDVPARDIEATLIIVDSEDADRFIAALTHMRHLCWPDQN